MARGLPKDGKIVTVDTSDEFLPIAKKYWDQDDQASKINSIIGDGTEVMQSYYERALKSFAEIKTKNKNNALLELSNALMNRDF